MAAQIEMKKRDSGICVIERNNKTGCAMSRRAMIEPIGTIHPVRKRDSGSVPLFNRLNC